MTTRQPSSGLRAQITRGGLHLGARQAIGIGVGLLSIFVITRLIGAEAYGLYAAAISIQTTVSAFLQLGVGVFLVREDAKSAAHSESVCLSLTLIAGLVGAAAGIIASSWLGDAMRVAHLQTACMILLPGLVLTLLRIVPQARLERELAFPRLARIELLGQLIQVAVTTPIAFRGGGVWAPIAGWWAQELVLFVILFRAARVAIRFSWHLETIRRLLRFGFGFSSALWAWQSRSSVASFVVGRSLGATGIAHTAMALRIAEAVGFFRAVSWRLSMPALSRVRHSAERLTSATTEAMGLQLLATGVPLLVVNVLLPPILPRVLGSSWLPMLDVLPLVSVAFMTNAALAMFSAAVYATDRTAFILAYNALNTGILGAVAWHLVPRMGLRGYGVAEVAAISAALLFLLAKVPKFRLDRFALLWWPALGIAMFSARFAPWSLIPLALVASWPDGWRILRSRLSFRSSTSEDDHNAPASR
jgi:O-antigen/teichoic acid export membrane protein